MKHKGFSLIELLVALSIAALLLGVAAPAFSAWTGKQRLRSAAYDLLNDLQLARSEAVKRAARITLNNGDGHWHSGWQIFVDSNGDGSRSPGETLLQARASFDNTLTINGNSSVSQRVSYVASGETRQTGGGLQMGTITLCSEQIDRALQVVISRGGRARLTGTSRSAAGC